MKNKIIIFITLTVFIAISFKVKDLNELTYKIEYVKYRELDKDLFDEEFKRASSKRTKERIWKQFNQRTYYSLKISGNKSIFETLPTIDNSQNNIDLSKGKYKLYRDLERKNSILKKDHEKKVLIQDSLFKFNWNMDNGEEDSMLGFKVKKATAVGKEEGSLITAYYATEFGAKHGPFIYWGLPGVILKIEKEYKDGYGKFIKQSIFEATSVEKTNETIKMPKTKGKLLLSNQEYQKKLKKQHEKHKEYTTQGVDKSD